MLHAIVLAGGSGTRFWPASRRALPKQLLAIGPDPSRSLIAATLERLAPLCPVERVLIATGEHLLPATRAALPELPPSAFLGEPVARNTAPCIAWATAIAARRDPDAILCVLPSDQHIADVPGFRAALERAVAATADGAIVTIGVKPTRPETGYGYIELGAEEAPGVRAALRFVEKPTRSVAEGYVDSGRFVWNAGMFFFKASALLAAVAEHLPSLYEAIEAIEAAARVGEDEERRVTRERFPSMPDISIDHGVMEKVRGLRVVPSDFGWSDLGSWESAWELSPRDDAGNAAPAGAVLRDAQRNLVRDLRTDGRQRVIALVGVDDLCVVETDDALLVLPRERAQDVKLVVEALKGSARSSLT
jgi:mannose-1-phosphate guanylyltransferase